MIVRAFVAIGANLGDARTAVLQAIADLDTVPQTHVALRSSLYRSDPVDAKGPEFVNAVVAVDTALDPLALLDALQRLERVAGRERPFRHAPRTLDLDLLTHGDTTLDTPVLTLPHPRMFERAFVLLPLAEIAPGHVDADLLARVAGQRIERV